MDAEHPSSDASTTAANIPSHLLCHYPGIHPPLPVRLTDLGSHPCSYLPDRQSSNRAFWADAMPSMVYQSFMDRGFRRSGKVVYQPVCSGCRRCISLRVPANHFEQSKSQRRVWRKNSDLTVTIAEAVADAEAFDLYQRYLLEWHGRSDEVETTFEAFTTFLYESPVPTLEYRYRDSAGRLVAVGICDRLESALSSVYFFHDPAEARRSLGTFGALYELRYCKERGIPYYYLGFWVDGCASMAYKATYWPHQILKPDGQWRDARKPGDSKGLLGNESNVGNSQSSASPGND